MVETEQVSVTPTTVITLKVIYEDYNEIYPYFQQLILSVFKSLYSMMNLKLLEQLNQGGWDGWDM